METKAIFLDRDGVINEEVNYLSDPNDFKFIEGSLEALKLLKEMDYLLIIITNQAGIARGYFSEEMLKEIHAKMIQILKQNDIKLTDIFYCPHHPDFTGPCNCRKPNPGMILQAREKYKINLKNSFIVGDTLIDIKTGIAGGCQTVLVLTGYGLEEQQKINEIIPDFIFASLLEFAKNLKLDSKL